MIWPRYDKDTAKIQPTYGKDTVKIRPTYGKETAKIRPTYGKDTAKICSTEQRNGESDQKELNISGGYRDKMFDSDASSSLLLQG